MTVADVMTRDIWAVAPDTSIETAARLLAARHVTGVPVLTSGGRPVGVVTLADLVDPHRTRSRRDGYPFFYHVTKGMRHEVQHQLGEGAKLAQGRVADVMSPFVLSIESSANLSEAANRLLSESVHRLLVMHGNELVGIVTSIDLLKGFVRFFNARGREIRG